MSAETTPCAGSARPAPAPRQAQSRYQPHRGSPSSAPPALSGHDQPTAASLSRFTIGQQEPKALAVPAARCPLGSLVPFGKLLGSLRGNAAHLNAVVLWTTVYGCSTWLSRPHSGQTRCAQQAGSPTSSCPVPGDEGTPARSSSIDAIIRRPFVCASGQPAAGSRLDPRRFNGVFVLLRSAVSRKRSARDTQSVPARMGAGPLALHAGRWDGNGGSSPDGRDGGRRSPGPPLPSW